MMQRRPTLEQRNKAQAWIKSALRTAYTTDKAKLSVAQVAVQRAFEVLQLPPPIAVLFVASPYEAAVTGAVACQVLAGLQAQYHCFDTIDPITCSASAMAVRVRQALRAHIPFSDLDQFRFEMLREFSEDVVLGMRKEIIKQLDKDVLAPVLVDARVAATDRILQAVTTDVVEHEWKRHVTAVTTAARDKISEEVLASARIEVRKQMEASYPDASDMEDRIERFAQQTLDHHIEQICTQIKDKIKEAVKFIAASSALKYDVIGGLSNYYGGNTYAPQASFVSQVLGHKLAPKFEIEHMLFDNCHWVWWHENVVCISDRPQKLIVHEKGTELTYRDGWVVGAYND